MKICSNLKLVPPPFQELSLLNRFDCLFWMGTCGAVIVVRCLMCPPKGDLNYRIEMEREQVLSIIKEKNYHQLKVHLCITASREDSSLVSLRMRCC